jgi:hypothetical protein
MKDMLDRLKRADPSTYKGYKYLCDCIVWQSWERGEDKPLVEERILQGELQEAIQARGYMFSVSHIWPKESIPAHMWKVRIFIDPDNIIETRDDRPAAALLAAYLAAIEGQA